MRTPTEILDAIRTRVQDSWHLDVSATTATWPCGFELASPTQQELEDDFDFFQSEADEWRAWADERDLELTTSLRRVNGSIQTIPTHLMINDLDTAVRLVGGEWERRVVRGRAHAALLESRFPGVVGIASVVRAVDRYSDTDFDLLTSTARWFREESDSGLAARELPIEGLTRGWLDANERLVLTLAGITSLGLAESSPQRIHFRYLDPDHLAEGGRQHDSATVGDSMQPAYSPDIVLVCEHPATALHIPPLSWAVSVEGTGPAGATALASFEWVSAASHVIYWGDLDAVSLETASAMREAGLDVRTILMDIPTFDAFERFGTTTDASGAELMPKRAMELSDGMVGGAGSVGASGSGGGAGSAGVLGAAGAIGSARVPGTAGAIGSARVPGTAGAPAALSAPARPSHLTESEALLYDRLTDPQWTGARRIEQERIPLAEAAKALAKVLSGRG